MCYTLTEIYVFQILRAFEKLSSMPLIMRHANSTLRVMIKYEAMTSELLCVVSITLVIYYNKC